MSTDKDMYAERENVLIVAKNDLESIHYDSILVGQYYTVPLISGTFSIYKKSNLFDDDLIKKVKTKEEAMQSLQEFRSHE